MKNLRLIAFLLAFTSISAIGQETEGVKHNNTSEWKVFSENEFSIEYPENWTLEQTGLMGTTFMIFSPLASNEDQFKENVNLLIQDLAGYNVNLDQFVEISNEQVETIITDGKIIESIRKTNNELKYQKVIFKGKQGIYNLMFEQYYWVENEKAYILTLTCEETQYLDYKDTGEKILDSFVLKLK